MPKKDTSYVSPKKPKHVAFLNNNPPTKEVPKKTKSKKTTTTKTTTTKTATGAKKSVTKSTANSSVVVNIRTGKGGGSSKRGAAKALPPNPLAAPPSNTPKSIANYNQPGVVAATPIIPSVAAAVPPATIVIPVAPPPPNVLPVAQTKRAPAFSKPKTVPSTAIKLPQYIPATPVSVQEKRGLPPVFAASEDATDRMNAMLSSGVKNDLDSAARVNKLLSPPRHDMSPMNDMSGYDTDPDLIYIKEEPIIPAMSGEKSPLGPGILNPFHAPNQPVTADDLLAPKSSLSVPFLTFSKLYKATVLPPTHELDRLYQLYLGTPPTPSLTGSKKAKAIVDYLYANKPADDTERYDNLIKRKTPAPRKPPATRKIN